MSYSFPFWKSCEDIKPTILTPILMKGDSGYIKPNNVLYISGYYDPEYRPLSPWLDSQSTCVSEQGLKPEFWCYISDLEELLHIDLGKM